MSTASTACGVEDEVVTPWDDYVPVFVSPDTRVVDIYLHNTILEPVNYSEAYREIMDRKEGDVVRLHILNGGGYIDSALLICDAIKMSKAKVVAYLSGTVASSATIIALSCHEIVCGNFLQFMIHNYSHGTSGKGHEVKQYVKFSDALLERIFRSVYGGFLTDKEITSVIDGQDLWMDEIEVHKRWQLKLAYKTLDTHRDIEVTDVSIDSKPVYVSKVSTKRSYNKRSSK